VSRIGNKPIEIPDKVQVKIEGGVLTAEGPKGELSVNIPEGIGCNIENNILTFSRNDDAKRIKSLHGLTRSLAGNVIDGVSKGFEKTLKVGAERRILMFDFAEFREASGFNQQFFSAEKYSGNPIFTSALLNPGNTLGFSGGGSGQDLSYDFLAANGGNPILGQDRHRHQALRLAAAKLPIKCKIVSREDRL